MMGVEKYQGGFSSRIGQWEKFQTLPRKIILETESYYTKNYFSVTVRDFLASWIEAQPWSSNVEEDTARYYLNNMIQEIWKCAAEQRISCKLNLENSAEMIKEHYGRCPLEFVYFMEDMMNWELKYLEPCEEKVENDAGGQSIETKDQTHYLEQLENSSKAIQKKIKSMISDPVGSHAETLMPDKKKLRLTKGKDLNDLKDGHAKKESEGIFQEQLDRLESMYQKLKCVMNDILDKNLQAWIRNQRLFENSARKDDIDQIQMWCSKIASLITESLQQIKELNQIEEIMILQQTQINQLYSSFIDLRKELVKRSFIITRQPPQIITKNNDMEASVTLLCGLPSNWKYSNVTAQLISPSDGKDKGTLKNYTCSIQDQGTAPFKKMKLTDVVRSKQKNQSVTEEKFLLKFSMEFSINGNVLPLEVFSLPVVVLTNVSQKILPNAIILWDNYFADYIPAGESKIPEKVPWPQFAGFLNYVFRKDIHVPLKPEHFRYFATKILDEPVDDLSMTYVTWDQFAKKKIMEKKDFTFWEWFHAIGNLIKTHLLELYQADLIMGFVERDQSKRMLLEKPAGTILLRFSDHTLGGISVAMRGVENVSDLKPFTSEILKTTPLAETMVKIFKKDYQKLYPDKPVKEAFQKYVGKKQDTAERLDDFGYKYCEVTIDVSFESNNPVAEQEEYQSIQNNNINPVAEQEQYQFIQNNNINPVAEQEQYQSIQNNNINPVAEQEQYQSIQNNNINPVAEQEEYQFIQNNNINPVAEQEQYQFIQNNNINPVAEQEQYQSIQNNNIPERMDFKSFSDLYCLGPIPESLPENMFDEENDFSICSSLSVSVDDVNAGW